MYYYHELEIDVKFIDKVDGKRHLDFNIQDKSALLQKLSKFAEKIEDTINYTYEDSELVSKLINKNLLSSKGISTKNYNFFNMLEENGFITFNIGAELIADQYYDEVEELFYEYKRELVQEIVDNLNELNLDLILNLRGPNYLYLKFET